MPDSARSGSLHDSAASNVEQDGDNERAEHTDANERGADAGNEEQSDEHEAGAPPPKKSVDLTAAKSEVELLTAQLAQQGAMLAQQRALFHQLQQGAATSAPNSASGSMMGLNAELASHENAQGGSDATTDPAATEPAPGTNHQYHHQGSPMHQPNPFPYAPHPAYNQFGAYGFPYHGFPPPFPPGFHPHGFMGQPNMVMPTPYAVPRDDPYDINNPLLCRQATRVTKVYTEKMLQAGTVSVGLLLVWIRSFSAFCKTLIVRNPVQLAIMHLRPPADSWAEQFVLPDGRPLISASWNEFTGALLHAPFTDSVEYFYTTTQAFCDLKQANLKVSEYVQQANDIFLGRETHPWLSQLTEGHFSFKFFMGLHPQIRLNIRLSPEALMNKAFTDLTSQAQEVGTHVESLDTRAPHQVAQMGRSGPRPSSQQTVTATPPVSLPANYWQMPVAQRRAFEKGLKQPGDKAWRKQTRRNEGRCVFCGDDRHVYEDCRLAPKVTVAVLDVDSESKNGKQAEE